MTSPKLLYVTCKDSMEAQTIARELVESRLAACGNIVPNIQSIYRWEDKIQIDSEAILIIKTAPNKVKECFEKIKTMHSYKTPCMLEIDVTRGDADYIAWLLSQTLPP